MANRTRVALASGALLVGAGAAAVWIGARAQQRAWERLAERFRERTSAAPATMPGSDALGTLPPPVARYLARSLPAGSSPLRSARLEQEGSIRTDPGSERWLPFRATHLVAPGANEFAWRARVEFAPLVHVTVTDALIAGEGSGRVALLAAFPISSAQGSLEMNSGSLHRFLAEAVWYPTALLPSDRLHWTPIDESSALAALSDHGVTVTLEFRFNEVDEVIGIYTPARWGTFGGGFKQRAWEGHFRTYREHDGMLIPTEGEVGWYVDGVWQSVWRGRVRRADYRR